MKASPIACMSGPQKRIGMRESPAWASISAVRADFTPAGSIVIRPVSLSHSTDTPWISRRELTTSTSLISGMFRSTDGELPSRAATMALGTRFLAPRTVTSPVSGLPPWMVKSFAMRVLPQRGRRATVSATPPERGGL